MCMCLACRGNDLNLSGGNSGRSYGGAGIAGGTGGSVTSGLDAHAGPRIFVGKLNRATTEADVREYFTRWGVPAAVCHSWLPLPHASARGGTSNQ